jgi:hypothetical protein
MLDQIAVLREAATAGNPIMKVDNRITLLLFGIPGPMSTVMVIPMYCYPAFYLGVEASRVWYTFQLRLLAESR